MSKSWQPNKQTVELKPSKIRRDPVPIERPTVVKKEYWDPNDWESWAVAIGVLAFAIAISIVWIAITEITSH